MISTTTLVLASAISALDPCSSILSNLEKQLKTWTPAARSIGEDYEAHSYRTVTPGARTITIYFVTAFGPEVQLRELRGFERLDSCEMNGMVGALLFKKTVK